jgi:hypothetical protein
MPTRINKVKAHFFMVVSSDSSLLQANKPGAELLLEILADNTRPSSFADSAVCVSRGGHAAL